MPSDPLFLRLDLRTLLAVLALTVPLLVADALWTVGRSHEDFTAASGTGLETLARVAAAGAESVVDAAVTEAGEIASRPDVRALAERRNKSNEGRTEIEIAALDKVWQTPEAGAEVERIVASPVAVSLREAVDRNRSLAGVIVTDRYGATAAASHKPTLYYHGDQGWWRIAYGDGRVGTNQASRARWDPVTERDAIGVAAPILDADGRQVIGVVRTVVPVVGLTGFLEEAQPRPSGDALIVTSGGDMVVSARSDRAPDDDVEELELARAAMAANDSGWLASEDGGETDLLIGFARTGLARAYPQLDWTVMVSQPLEEATAPIAAMNRRVLLGAGLAILLVVILAVYLSNHRARQLDPLEHIERA